MIFFVTGISAAGKTTVSELLAKRFERGVHVKGDVFRRMVVSGREHMRPSSSGVLDPDRVEDSVTTDASPEAERQLDLRYRLGAATADTFHDAGFDVVVQDIVMGPAVATYVSRIRGRPLHVVVLAPRVDVVRARERARPKTAYQPDGPTVEDLDSFLRRSTPRIGLWLDTSDQTPEQTVDEILARRDEALV